MVENEQQLSAKYKMQELEVKLLKLIYVCLAGLGEKEMTAYQGARQDGRDASRGIDQKQCLADIANVAFISDVHLKQSSTDNPEICKEDYILQNLKLFERMFFYDSTFNKQGLLQALEKADDRSHQEASFQTELEAF